MRKTKHKNIQWSVVFVWVFKISLIVASNVAIYFYFIHRVGY